MKLSIFALVACLSLSACSDSKTKNPKPASGDGSGGGGGAGGGGAGGAGAAGGNAGANSQGGCLALVGTWECTNPEDNSKDTVTFVSDNGVIVVKHEEIDLILDSQPRKVDVSKLGASWVALASVTGAEATHTGTITCGNEIKIDFKTTTTSDGGWLGLFGEPTVSTVDSKTTINMSQENGKLVYTSQSKDTILEHESEPEIREYSEKCVKLD